jgi:hypothetical protein
MGFWNLLKLNRKPSWQQVGYVKGEIDYYDNVPRWVAERIEHDREQDGFWQCRYQLEGMHYIYRITPYRSGDEPAITVERRPR